MQQKQIRSGPTVYGDALALMKEKNPGLVGVLEGICGGLNDRLGCIMPKPASRWIHWTCRDTGGTVTINSTDLNLLPQPRENFLHVEAGLGKDLKQYSPGRGAQLMNMWISLGHPEIKVREHEIGNLPTDKPVAIIENRNPTQMFDEELTQTLTATLERAQISEVRYVTNDFTAK